MASRFFSFVVDRDGVGEFLHFVFGDRAEDDVNGTREKQGDIQADVDRPRHTRSTEENEQDADRTDTDEACCGFHRGHGLFLFVVDKFRSVIKRHEGADAINQAGDNEVRAAQEQEKKCDNVEEFHF